MKNIELFDYLERLGNLLRNEERHEGKSHGLQPVQLEALHYLSICNRYSDTPMGVTEYLGQTKGTVSQSLKLLEKNGYITKHVDPQDKRSVHLKVTQLGKKLIHSLVPPPLINKACEILDEQQQIQIITALRHLLRAKQSSNNMNSFGVCKTSRYNQTIKDKQYYCELTKETLSEADIQLICREHEINI